MQSVHLIFVLKPFQNSEVGSETLNKNSKNQGGTQKEAERVNS